MRHFPGYLWIGLLGAGLAAQAVPVQKLQAMQTRAKVPRAERQTEYLLRLKALPKNDTRASLALATWCRKKRLFPEMRASLAPVLDRDPDQAEARALLGHLKVGQKWMPKAKAFKAMGYTFHRGTWRSPAEMKALKEALVRKRHLARVSSTLSKLARILVGPDDKRSEKARDDFLVLVRQEKLHRLGYEAEKAWYRARKFWKTHRRAVTYDRIRGTIAMRAQMTKLLGFQNYTTSLGTGSPVTIQLPRTRSIGIGTSVPFGR